MELDVRGRSVFESGMTPRSPVACSARSKVGISMTSTLCGNSAGGGEFGARILVTVDSSLIIIGAYFECHGALEPGNVKIERGTY